MDQRRRRRLVSRIITWTVVAGVVVLIGLGFVPKPVPVVIGNVERKPLEVTVDEPGKTRIRTKYVISSPGIGQLSRITLRAGDTVEADAVLAELSPIAPQLLDERTRAEAIARAAVAQANLARTQAAIKRAETAVSFARDQAERTRKLHRESGTSQQALEQAEYQQRSAEEELATAQLGERVASNELAAARAALASMTGDPKAAPGKVQLVAPARGQVLRVFQESEGVVQAGAPLLELGDPRALEVVVDVLSTDAVRIEPGSEARIERWGGELPLRARVRSKQPSAFTTRSALGVEEQRVPVLLDITDDPARWQALGDGYRIEAKIRVAQLPNAVVVPAAALFRAQGTWAAFTLRDGRAQRIELELGARTPDWVEVKSGLAPGAAVVLYPSDQVRDGVALAQQTPRS